MRIPVLPIIFILLAMLLSLSAKADWVDDMSDLLLREPATLSNTVTPSRVDPRSYGLPSHWSTYFLHEPIYDGNIFIAEVGNKLNPTVLLVHGLGQNGLNDWLSVVSILEKKYHVVLLDLPGFARSDNPNAKLTPTRYSEILHFLKPSISKNPVTIVGHSMGGAVALRYSATYPSEVNKLLLVDAAGILQRTAFVKHSITDRIPLDDLSWSNSLLGFAVGLQDIGTGFIEKLINVPDPMSLLGKSDLAWGLAFSKIPNVNAALGLIEEDFSQAIFTLQKPVEMLWGQADTIAPLRTSKLLLKNLPQSNLTLIPGAGHMPMATHSEQFNLWILKALEQNTILSAKGNLATQETAPTQGDYHCENSEGGTASGRFDHMFISNCVGLKLSDLVAQDMVIKNSVVELNDVTLKSKETSIAIESSTLLATNSTVAGKIKTGLSRMDFAGVQFQSATPFKITDKSRIILSVCRYQLAGGVGYLHADLTMESSAY
jgi:pimeloyl-ACP methyl ester carboxylesterase